MAAERPNLLLIFTDMQRWDTVRALGNPIIRTPALDRLAREGTAFTNCYTPSPVCVSARYAMHYGRWPSRTGVTENQSMPADLGDSYAALLSKAGYRTHAIGKLHFTPDSRALRGFGSRESQEEMVGRPDQDDYLQYLVGQGFGHIRDPHGVRGEMYYIPQVAQMPAEHHPTQWIGDRSLAFIEDGAKRREPWMLMSSYIHPHPPFAPPNPWHKLYRGFDMPLPSVPPDAQALLTWINRMQNRGKYRDQGFDQHLLRQMKAYYYACVSFVDFQVGRLLGALERTGQLERTLVLFTSDHGEFLGDLGCFGKRSMHDASTRVPLLARLPGRLPAGVAVERPASLVDVSATFLAAAGVAPAAGMVGEDLATIADGRSARDTVFAQCGSEGVAQYLAVTPEWKYFYSAPDDAEFLFDRRADPHETRNRAGLPTTRTQLITMRRRLLRHLVEQGAEAAYEREGAGEPRWRKWPRLEMPRDPDAGLMIQDHAWAINDIEGYTDTPRPSISSWQVIGPFPGTVRDDQLLAQDTPFEADFRRRGDGTVDLAATWAAEAMAAAGGAKSTPARQLAWKPATARPNGLVDLITALGPHEHVIAYAYAELDWAESRSAVISCGSDDGIKIWVNGEPVLEHEGERGFMPDEDEATVRLRPGRNRLLVKCDNWVGGWGFGVRLR